MLDRARIEEIVNRFKNQHLLVVGDLMLDRYIWGRVERISPEAPVPVVVVSKEEAVCGGASNVAANISRFGSKVSLVGLIGEDFYGKILREELKKVGVPSDHLVVSQKNQTIVKSRVIGNNQQIVRIDREETEPNYLETEPLIMRKIKDILSKEPISGVLISDYAKGVLGSAVCDLIVRESQKKGLFVSVDPKLKNFPLYKKVGVITPNQMEASQTLGTFLDSEEKVLEAGRTLLKRHQAEAILITRGADGMQLFETTGKISKIGTRARKVYDVTGAGDSVIATFSLVKAAGGSMVEAAEISNLAAGFVVGILGTATCSQEELLEFHEQTQNFLEKHPGPFK